jgi:hypothetical protein
VGPSVKPLDVRAHVRLPRIPRVRNLDYLRAVLKSAQKEGCSKREATLSVIEVVRSLDAAKASALGRTMAPIPKGQHLTEQCLEMGRQLGLLAVVGDRVTLMPLGLDVMRSMGTPLEQQIFFGRLWSTYPQFRSVLLITCNDARTMVLPLQRSLELFASAAVLQGLFVDQMSFELVRDLGTNLRILNWRTKFGDRGGEQTVYAVQTCVSCEGQGGPSREAEAVSIKFRAEWLRSSYRPPSLDGTLYEYVENKMDIPPFEQQLWSSYLDLAKDIPLFPVLYSQLRDNVCEAGRISDATFDRLLASLMRNPRRLDIYPSSGVMPYSARAAVSYKQIPARMDSGDFMTFLKLTRRAGGPTA